MNALLWTLQGLLALHTLIGAIWKFANPETMIPSLAAIPHSVWIALSIVEIFAVIGLLIPVFRKALWTFAVASGLFVTTEMLFFSMVHLASGRGENGQLVYWLILATVSTTVAFGRWTHTLLDRRQRHIRGY